LEKAIIARNDLVAVILIRAKVFVASEARLWLAFLVLAIGATRSHCFYLLYLDLDLPTYLSGQSSGRLHCLQSGKVQPLGIITSLLEWPNSGDGAFPFKPMLLFQSRKFSP
jgi:hypothetical protein